MKHEGLVDVWVSDHARTRGRERCPGFKAARIVDEVRAALREGRVAARKPEWIRGYHGLDAECLYTWTANGERCYPIKAVDNGFTVLTTIAKECP